MPEPVERIVTLVTPAEHKRVKIACAKAGVTMAALLRQLVLAWLRKTEEEKTCRK